MSWFWTDSPHLLHAAGSPRRARALTAALAVLLFAGACSKSSDDSVDHIKPITGSITVNPISDDPAVYFQVAPSNGDPALLDVMFRNTASGPTDMVGFNLEIHYDQSIVQLGGELADGTLTGTPLGNCGVSCMASCGGMSCQTCDFCNNNSLAITTSGQSLLCLANLNANQTGTLLIGVSSTPTYSDIGCLPVQVSTPVRLARLHLFPATTGTSHITLIQSSPTNTGGCAILGPGSPPVDLGIPCVDGGAIFTASR